MKISINNVQLLGNIIDDPTYTSENGFDTAVLFIMTNKVGTDSEGNLVQHPQINRAFLYNELLGFVKSNVKKGSYVYISGELETRFWKDDNNQDQSFSVVIAKQISLEQEDDAQPPKTKPASSTSNKTNVKPKE